MTPAQLEHALALAQAECRELAKEIDDRDQTIAELRKEIGELDKLIDAAEQENRRNKAAQHDMQAEARQSIATFAARVVAILAYDGPQNEAHLRSSEDLRREAEELTGPVEIARAELGVKAGGFW